MDSITHGLVAMLAFHATFPGLLVLFAVLGAVLPDSDVLLSLLSDRDPRLFVFTHGGFTHSIPGSAAIAFGVAAGFQAWQYLAGQGHVGVTFLVLAWALAWAGALSHIALDALAFPGIPLLYPASTRKYSAGIFPGPSLVLFGTSLGFLLMHLAGYAGTGALYAYMAFVGVFVAAHAVLKAFVAARHPGLTIPTFNPMKWLVVREVEDSYEVCSAGLSRECTSIAVFPRYDGVRPEYLDRHSNDPEMARVTYHSYITVAARRDGSIVVRDPLRDSGILRYPPYYRSVRLPEEERGTP